MNSATLHIRSWRDLDAHGVLSPLPKVVRQHPLFHLRTNSPSYHDLLVALNKNSTSITRLRFLALMSTGWHRVGGATHREGVDGAGAESDCSLPPNRPTKQGRGGSARPERALGPKRAGRLSVNQEAERKSPFLETKPGAGLCTGPEIVVWGLGLSQRKNLSQKGFPRKKKSKFVALQDSGNAEHRERSDSQFVRLPPPLSQLCSEKGLETSGMFEPLTEGHFSPGLSKGHNQ